MKSLLSDEPTTGYNVLGESGEPVGCRPGMGRNDSGAGDRRWVGGRRLSWVLISTTASCLNLIPECPTASRAPPRGRPNAHCKQLIKTEATRFQLESITCLSLSHSSIQSIANPAGCPCKLYQNPITSYHPHWVQATPLPCHPPHVVSCPRSKPERSHPPSGLRRQYVARRVMPGG